MPEFVTHRENGILHGPPDVKLGVVPPARELPSRIVIAALLVMEYGPIAQHKMPVAELRGDQDLMPVLFGKHERLPLQVVIRFRIVVDDHQVKLPA